MLGTPSAVQDAEAGLRQAATLVQEGLTALLEWNVVQGRQVQEACNRLLVDLDAWEEGVLSSWPDDPGSTRQLALAREVEALARAGQQLAGLAASRPPPQVQASLSDAVRRLSAPLAEALHVLADPARPPHPDALAGVRLRQRPFMDWCADLGRRNPRLLSACLLAITAGHRIHEAAEAATAAGVLSSIPAVGHPRLAVARPAAL